MLALGGVRHLTGGSKREGNVTCQAMLDLCSRKPVEVEIEDGAKVVLQAGAAPVVNGAREERMRVGCGSATIGIFAKQWHGHADEVIVVDDHITGVLTEHQAGRFLDMPPAGIRVRGRKSTPGRYFQVAEPGLGWGGTDISDPLEIIERIDAKVAWPGLRLLMVSTTGEDAAWYVLDEQLRPVPAAMPAPIAKVVERIAENCEPALTTVLFMAGAGGLLARRRDREPGAPDPLGQAGADPRHLRRRPGLRLAGRRHHADGRRHAGCPRARSATCRRRRWSRRSSSPSRAQDYAALGGHLEQHRARSRTCSPSGA